MMGHAMRTDRYRLVAWRDHRDPQAAPIFVELFDHQTDPRETTNIARESPQVVQELMIQLDAGWRVSLQ